MMNMTNDTCVGAARVREYRARVAQALVALLNPDEVMDGVSWDALERLPEWFLLSDDELKKLSDRVAVTALIGSISKLIDGGVLSRISHCVGSDFLRRALSLRTSHSHGNDAIYFDWHLDQKVDQAVDQDIDLTGKQLNAQLQRVGASILLSSIDDEFLATIISRRFGTETVSIPREAAKKLVQQADRITKELGDLYSGDDLSVSRKIPSALFSTGSLTASAQAAAVA